jgi:hypothetical protein
MEGERKGSKTIVTVTKKEKKMGADMLGSY